jgi:serine/threonine protein kinase
VTSESEVDGGQPRIVGRYALHRVLASGGMARVHVGRLLGQVGFARTVAIKRLHPQFASDPEFVAMFLDEARLAARIRHPNVVSVLDVIATDEELLLVMDYVHGESLGRLMRAVVARGERVPPDVCVAILADTLAGLHAAHEATDEQGAALGIVHRDVSPENILVGADGHARVLDFGIAKAAGRSRTTQDGQLKGKLAYMAPEQLRGEKVDRRTDVYAASVVLWEIATGERLFKAENEGAIVAMVLEGDVPTPTARLKNKGVVLGAEAARALARIDAVTRRGLSRDAAKRYPSALEMAVALEKALTRATPSEVAAWVEATVGDLLADRKRLVASVESGHAATSQPDLPRAQASPPEEPTRKTGPTLAGTASVVASRRARSRRAALWIAAAVGLIATAAVVRAGLFPRPGARSEAIAPTAPAPPAPSAGPQAQARDPAATAQPSTASAASASVAAAAPATAPPSSAASVGSAAIHRLAGVPAHTPSAAPTITGAPETTTSRPGCSPPYTWDDQGMKHYKPECL